LSHVPPFTPDRRLFPFESRWFDSSAGTVHYIDEGVGDPILFLHGNPTWSFLYRGIIIRLKKRFRCIAIDYPGFGLSEAPDNYGYTPADHADVVRALVQHLGLQNLTIMGQDWGGPIGLRVALDEMPRLRALVMGNTWYWPIDTLVAKTFAYIMSSAPLQSQILRRNLFVEKIMPMMVKYALAEEVMHHYREALSTPTRRVGAAEFPRQLIESTLWLGELADEVRERLSNVPILLPWGLHDPAFPQPYLERFREDFTVSQVLRLDAKHYIQEDAPGEIAEAIQGFLDALPATGTSLPA
jgi:haloalkane dehalogenase